MENFDVKQFEELTEQIKKENPKLDLELCKYISASYLIYDVMKLEKPTSDAKLNEVNEMIEKLSLSNTIEIEA